jgi:hypothetical protein
MLLRDGNTCLSSLRQKVRKMGYNGFGPKSALPKMSSFKDEDWMGMFSYMFAMYDTNMQINGKIDFATAQKQAIKYVWVVFGPRGIGGGAGLF